MGDGEVSCPSLRPMNCPHHIEVYKHHVHSTVNCQSVLPEIVLMHQLRKIWCLQDFNVREMSLNDGHTFRNT